MCEYSCFLTSSDLEETNKVVEVYHGYCSNVYLVFCNFHCVAEVQICWVLGNFLMFCQWRHLRFGCGNILCCLFALVHLWPAP